MIDLNHLHSLARSLEEYAAYDGTEYGETTALLIQLSRYSSFVSEEFLAALTLEMEDQLDNYQTYSTIEETEEVTVRKVKTLVW